MATPAYIEVPVTCQSWDVYYIQVTDKVLEDSGCMCAAELRNLIACGEISPFDLDGEWDSCDSEIQDVHYEDARLC